MAMTYKIYPDKRIVVQKWVGTFDLEAIKTLTNGLYNDPSFQPYFCGLCDVRNAEWKIGEDGILKINEFVAKHPRGPRGPWAIVCAKPMQTAYALIYESIKNPPHPSKTFSTEEAALNWLSMSDEGSFIKQTLSV